MSNPSPFRKLTFSKLLSDYNAGNDTSTNSSTSFTEDSLFAHVGEAISDGSSASSLIGRDVIYEKARANSMIVKAALQLPDVGPSLLELLDSFSFKPVEITAVLSSTNQTASNEPDEDFEKFKKVLVEAVRRLSPIQQRQFQSSVIQIKDDQDNNLLHRVAYKNQFAILNYLLQNFPSFDLDSKNKMLATPLHCAASAGACDCVFILVNHEQNKSRDGKDFFGSAPIHLAVQGNHKNVIDILIQFGKINVNLKKTGSNSDTALHIAAQQGKYELVKLLIEKGNAMMNARNDEGKSALQSSITTTTAAPISTTQGGVNLFCKTWAYLLKSNTVDAIKVRDTQNKTLLHTAVETDNIKFLFVMATCVPSKFFSTLFQQKDNHKLQTCIHRAVELGRYNCLEFLLYMLNPLFKQSFHDKSVMKTLHQIRHLYYTDNQDQEFVDFLRSEQNVNQLVSWDTDTSTPSVSSTISSAIPSASGSNGSATSSTTTNTTTSTGTPCTPTSTTAAPTPPTYTEQSEMVKSVTCVLNEVDKNNDTALHIAARKLNELQQKLGKLVNEKMELNEIRAMTEFKQLYIYYKMVHLLILNGANLKAKNSQKEICDDMIAAPRFKILGLEYRKELLLKSQYDRFSDEVLIHSAITMDIVCESVLASNIHSDIPVKKEKSSLTSKLGDIVGLNFAKSRTDDLATPPHRSTPKTPILQSTSSSNQLSVEQMGPIRKTKSNLEDVAPAESEKPRTISRRNSRRVTNRPTTPAVDKQEKLQEFVHAFSDQLQ